MTKAEIVAQIAEKTGVEKSSTQVVVEAFMEIVKKSVAEGEPVYLSHKMECTGIQPCARGVPQSDRT